MKFFIAVTFILVASLSAVAAKATKDFPSDSVFHLKGEWLNQDGKSTQLDELEGQVTIVAMVYTSCQFSCPLIVQDLNRIRSKISEKNLAKVKLVLISMDPLRDTPEVLRDFAAKRKLDPAVWRLYTAKKERLVREFAVIIGANIQKTGKEFAHSNIIAVIGPNGVIAFSKPNLGQQVDETAASVDKLANALVQ